MAITVVEEFQAQDWDRYAAFIGPFLPGLVLGISVLGFLVGQHTGTQVCVLLTALFLALLETPKVYFLCPPCHRLRDKLLEDCGFGKGWVKGLSYAVLSLPCFLPRPSVAILAGILLVLAAVVNACASFFADEPISMTGASSSSSSSISSKATHTVLPSYQPPTVPSASGAGAGAGAAGAKNPPVVAGFGTFNL